MASIWEKAISILAGNLNSGCSYLITAVSRNKTGLHTLLDKKMSPGRLSNGGFVNLNFVKFCKNDLESLDR